MPKIKYFKVQYMGNLASELLNNQTQKKVCQTCNGLEMVWINNGTKKLAKIPCPDCQKDGESRGWVESEAKNET